MTITNVEAYQWQTRALLAKRALGHVSEDEECEIAEKLDEIWSHLTEDERREIEAWIREILPAHDDKDTP